VNRPDLAPGETAVAMGPAGTRRRPVPGNDISHPADVPKAASRPGSHYAIQTLIYAELAGAEIGPVQ
jgi:hypothetical protein